MLIAPVSPIIIFNCKSVPTMRLTCPDEYHKLRDPGIWDQRKWRPKEEMGGNGRAREREREGGGESVLKSVALVCKMIEKNHRNARSVYILPLKKPGLLHLSRFSKKSNIRFKRK